MYNQERKLKFLSEKRESSDYGISIFSATEAAEKALDKDLCELNAEVFDQIFEDSFGTRQRAVNTAIALLQSYVVWCREQGFKTSNAVFELDVDITSKIRRMMVASPMHLASILDQSFSPLEDGSVDCIYRCYLWMIFMGINDYDTVKVRVADVDFENLTVDYEGRKYDLYREALPAFRMACTATEFNYVHENPYYTSVRQRFPGELLMRGIRSDHMNLMSIRPYIKQKLSAKGFNLSARRIRLSGIFYRAYETERCGFEVNFNEPVLDQLEGRERAKERTYSANYSRQKAAKAIERDFQNDYENWKKAFSVH